MTRRSIDWRGALGLLFLAVVAMGVMSPVAFRPDRVIAGADMHVFYGWELQIRRAFAQGQWPLWNPYVFSGYPSLADLETAIFYPPSLLLRFLPINTFFAWQLVFHLFLTGAGTYLTCRESGTNRIGALVAATGLMLSGAVVTRIYWGHLNLILSYAWIPLGLGLAIRSVRRGSTLPSAALIGVLAMQVLVGFPQVTAYAVALISLYFVYSLAWPPAESAGRFSRARLGVQMLLLWVMVAGLTAFQTLPAVRFAAEAGRTQGVTYARASAGALVGTDFVSLVLPTLVPGRNPAWDGSLFIGVVLLAFVPLAFGGRDTRRYLVFYSAIAIGALVLALGDRFGAYRLHFWLMPGFRIPTRVVFFWSLAAAILGAHGLARFQNTFDDRKGPRRTVVTWLPAGLAGAGVVIAEAVLRGARMELGGRWGVIAGLAALVAMGVLQPRGWRRSAAAVALLVATLEGAIFAARFVEPTAWTPHPAREVLKTLGPSRAVSVCERLVSASDLLYEGIPTPDGFGGLYLADYARFVSVVRQRPDSVLLGRIGAASTDWPVRFDLLGLLNVTHVLACGQADVEDLRPITQVGEISILENLRARPRAFLTCAGPRLPDDLVLWHLRNGTYDHRGKWTVLPPHVAIRWAEGVTEPARVEKERAYGLIAPELAEGRTWRYLLSNRSAANVATLVADPVVEDTAGIDRGSRWAIERKPSAELRQAGGRQSVLLGVADCRVTGSVSVLTKDQADGHLRALVNAPKGGLLVMGEPFYAERAAFVDGQRVPAERVNVALTGVMLPPGRHLVELRMRPVSLYIGSFISAATVIAWAVGLWTRRRYVRHRR